VPRRLPRLSPFLIVFIRIIRHLAEYINLKWRNYAALLVRIRMEIVVVDLYAAIVGMAVLVVMAQPAAAVVN